MNSKRNSSIFALFLLLFLNACSSNIEQASNDPFKDCKFGKPTAIFEANTPSVANTTFKIEGKEGIEQVFFESGKELEIVQSGCNEVKQEFFFRMKSKKMVSDMELFALAIQQLNDMGKLAENLKAFSFWAQAIFDKHKELKKGKKVELEPKTYVTIDQIDDKDDTIIWIILEQNP